MPDRTATPARPHRARDDRSAALPASRQVPESRPAMGFRRATTRTQNTLLFLQLLGDAVVCYTGLALSYWLRFRTPVNKLGIEVADITFAQYQPLLILGTLLLVFSFGFLNLYDARLLLRPHRALSVIFKATFFWVITFLGVSLALKFDPPISRIFVALSGFTTLGTITVWRHVFYDAVNRSRLREDLVQRLLLIGWNLEANRLAEAVHSDGSHAYKIVGCVLTPATAGDDTSRPLPGIEVEHGIDTLEEIFTRQQIDIAVIADMDLNRQQFSRIYAACERSYVAFKVIPSFFQIFVSNLRMQTVAGVPILGLEQFGIATLLNQLVKRCIDIVGGLFGIICSAPVIGLLAYLIRREDPGPVFFVQERIGQDGQPFKMIKLRSMRLGADKLDHVNQSTQREDPRLLSIGALIRKLNLDEVPQFWNVLRGDMSLVGPRPERTYHAHKLAGEIPNYASRHIVKPGLTGWAQVNGLRGDTDLTERVKYDLYYIENWSFWFDVQIMMLTFFRRKNAY